MYYKTVCNSMLTSSVTSMFRILVCPMPIRLISLTIHVFTHCSFILLLIYSSFGFQSTFSLIISRFVQSLYCFLYFLMQFFQNRIILSIHLQCFTNQIFSFDETSHFIFALTCFPAFQQLYMPCDLWVHLNVFLHNLSFFRKTEKV